MSSLLLISLASLVFAPNLTRTATPYPTTIPPEGVNR